MVIYAPEELDRPGRGMGSQFGYHWPDEQQCKGELNVLSVWYGGFTGVFDLLQCLTQYFYLGGDLTI